MLFGFSSAGFFALHMLFTQLGMFRCAAFLATHLLRECARLTARATCTTIPCTADRRTSGSWEPEIIRLAELHGFSVYRCGNRTRTHNPEVPGSPPFVGTGESYPCYPEETPERAPFRFGHGIPPLGGLARVHQPRERHSSRIGHLP
jgi:hypothetical protein